MRMTGKWFVVRSVLLAAGLFILGASAWADSFWTGKTGEIVLPSGDTTVTDADIAAFEALTDIAVNGDSRLIINTTADVTMKAVLHGAGVLVKRGTSTLLLPEINSSNKKDGATADHFVDGGFLLEGGAIKTPQSATTAKSYPVITMSADTVFYTQIDKETKVMGLNGHGVVTNLSSSVQYITLGFRGDPTHSRYYGAIGGKIAISVLGRQDLLGTTSTANGNSPKIYRNKDAGGYGPVYGALGIANFGMNGQPSSVGAFTSSNNIDLRYSGYLLYLGSGETTDRALAFRYITGAESSYPNTLDVGATGGVRFEGKWEFAKTDGNAAEVVLTGSNTVPCVVACEIKDGVEGLPSAFLHKRGSGTWRFADHASRGNRGVIAVEEGTLQFDSIANKGEVCSLGLATMLQSAYQGSYTPMKDVPYAYLLGNAATTNVVFEYTGATKCTATNRFIALTGKGATLKSTASTLAGGISLAGVSALASGDAVKTLWLDGTNLTSRLADVTDGEGKVGVMKVGSGRWTLDGAQTFSGPLVIKEGELHLAPTKNYTWFRFNVRGTGNQVFFFGKTGLFDKDGYRQDLGIKMLWPYDTVYKDGKPVGDYYENPIETAFLEPGELTFSPRQFHYNVDNPPDKLFISTSGSYWRSAWQTTGIGWNSTNSWIRFIYRLPAGAREVTGFDVIPYTSTQRVTAFSLDGSVDGENWTELLSKSSYDMPENAGWWASTSNESYSATAPHTPAEGWRFVGHVGDGSVSTQLVNASVSVAPGAKRVADGEGVTLSRLTLDGTGNGTVAGVTFAPKGQLRLSNLPTSAVFDVPMTFARCTGIANLSNWAVYKGESETPTGSLIVTADETGLHVRRTGLMLIVR